MKQAITRSEQYYKNELAANRHMSFATAIGGLFLLTMLPFYWAGVFTVSHEILIIVSIVLPIDAIILLTPLLFLKTERIKKSGFKYYLVFSFLFVIAVLNIILPKHGILAWALPIIATNHYYNRKLGRVVFFVSLGAMLICLYLGLFFGEYDPSLFGQPTIVDGAIYEPSTPIERFEFLAQKSAEGSNRYLKIFLFYYLIRGGCLALIYLVSDALNRRSEILLRKELTNAAEAQKVATEIEVAKEIQLATLPKDFSAARNAEIIAELTAARDVGGDFYDYYAMGDTIAILIGDVSGKGIPAAMFMMKVITCFKNTMNPTKKPSEILKEVNRIIVQGNDSKMFVTCFLAFINAKTGEVEYANAGHNRPIIGHNHQYSYLNCSSGFLLGGLPEAFVIDERTTLQPGDVITLYTDGLTEARNGAGDFYGEERLLNLYNKNDYTSLSELQQSLNDDVKAFVAGEEQSDDLTILSLKYLGSK